MKKIFALTLVLLSLHALYLNACDLCEQYFPTTTCHLCDASCTYYFFDFGGGNHTHICELTEGAVIDDQLFFTDTDTLTETYGLVHQIDYWYDELDTTGGEQSQRLEDDWSELNSRINANPPRISQEDAESCTTYLTAAGIVLNHAWDDHFSHFFYNEEEEDNGYKEASEQAHSDYESSYDEFEEKWQSCNVHQTRYDSDYDVWHLENEITPTAMISAAHDDYDDCISHLCVTVEYWLDLAEDLLPPQT